ncbi:5-oxoprolinase subunit PxpA [Microbacterium sediminicola]|uniref:5-oxoprolinase subunit PxpA n=1 Tax=Microbacterium sediminicola TaxID=415210 RepID=A0ABN2IKF7_9MICO
MGVIDLNADLGETVEGVPTADDEALFAVVSSANVACGGHAGDAASMAASVERAARFAVAIGAHPSYPDLAGFGRRKIAMSAAELRSTITEQLAALARAGADIRYVKPHGALYHAVMTDADHADAIAAAVADLAAQLGRDVPVLGMPGVIAVAVESMGLSFVPEAFLDRGYRGDGTLVPRGEPGALETDAATVSARAVRFVREGIVETVEGTAIELGAASLCVHGDSPESVALARAVRAALDADGVEVRAPW